MSKQQKFDILLSIFLGLYFKGRVYLFISQLLLRLSFFGLLANKDNVFYD
jgi:hypothetical protein